jgi:hypothetical protein
MVNAPLILRFGPASVQNGNLEVKKVKQYTVRKMEKDKCI